MNRDRLPMSEEGLYHVAMQRACDLLDAPVACECERTLLALRAGVILFQVAASNLGCDPRDLYAIAADA